MSKTTFVIKGVDFQEILRRVKPVDNGIEKTRFDIMNPGKVSTTTHNGGAIRVMQRGGIYNKDGSVYNRECGKPCWWHRHAFDGLAMGIPIKISIEFGVNRVFADGVFCSYSCAMAYLMDELEKIPARRNPNFTNSMTLLKQIFAEEFPGIELVAARDWRLMKDVGNGDLTLKEFLFGMVGMRFVCHPNITFEPITVSYDIVPNQH